MNKTLKLINKTCLNNILKILLVLLLIPLLFITSRISDVNTSSHISLGNFLYFSTDKSIVLYTIAVILGGLSISTLLLPFTFQYEVFDTSLNLGGSRKDYLIYSNIFYVLYPIFMTALAYALIFLSRPLLENYVLETSLGGFLGIALFHIKVILLVSSISAILYRFGIKMILGLLVSFLFIKIIAGFKGLGLFSFLLELFSSSSLLASSIPILVLIAISSYLNLNTNIK